MIYVITATARFQEVDGMKHFLYKKAFTDRREAEEAAVRFGGSIEMDASGPLTYCDVKIKVFGLELIGISHD